MPAVQFQYDVDDSQATQKLESLSSKLRNVKREVSEVRRGMNDLRKVGNITAGAVGAAGGFVGGGGADTSFISYEGAKNIMAASVGGILGRGVAGKVQEMATSGLIPTPMLGRLAGGLAGGLVGLAAGFAIDKVSEAAKPLFQTPQVDASGMSNMQLINSEQTAQAIMDKSIHSSFGDHWMWGGMYRARKDEAQSEILRESRRRDNEVIDALWLQYRE